MEAQQLPENPDPNKCYVRITAPEEVVYTYEDYLTYTPEDATRYPHQEFDLQLAEEYIKWEPTYCPCLG